MSDTQRTDPPDAYVEALQLRCPPFDDVPEVEDEGGIGGTGAQQ